MKLFLLVSDRRSGTNNLGYMLGQYPEVFAAGEIFHSRTSFGGFEHFEAFLGHLGARIGLEPGLAPAARDRAVVAWTHAHPIATVEALLDFAGSKGRTCTIFKIFPGHLRAWQLDRIVGVVEHEALHHVRRGPCRHVEARVVRRIERDRPRSRHLDRPSDPQRAGAQAVQHRTAVARIDDHTDAVGMTGALRDDLDGPGDQVLERGDAGARHPALVRELFQLPAMIECEHVQLVSRSAHGGRVMQMCDGIVEIRAMHA